MTEFAKLFETEYGQILATLDYDDDRENAYAITIRGTSRHGITPELAHRYENEADQLADWPKVTQEEADRQAKEFAVMLDRFMEAN